MKKKILSLLLAFVLLVGLLPTVALAASGDPTKQVHVIVENTTFTEATEASGDKEPAWKGELVEEWITLGENTTLAQCIEAALGDDCPLVNPTGNYISAINGLAEFDGGPQSGWMVLLNDWFINEGVGQFSADKGNLVAGDEIRVCYTSTGLGEDLGGSFNNNDKTLKALSFSAGRLNETFDKDTLAYTLTVPTGVTSVVAAPTASNKNFQVRTYVGTTEYKRTEAIPVAEGTVITVKCGDPSWPTMNNQAGGTGEAVPAVTYTITVSVANPDATRWDGETKTEPVKNSDDVYQIGTGAELAWFVRYYIDQKTPVSGILTADIDLGGHDWVADTNVGNGKSFILDGQNHSIRGLKAKYGFIGAIGGSSKIQNLSVYGEISGGTTRVGGIVGYLGGGTIENCVNYASITVDNADEKFYAGGIVGHSYNDNVKILNCGNHGNISCNGNFVGGITGAFGKKAYISGCYNVGNVTGKNFVGGIVGSTNSKKSSILGCYNTGNITGTENVGGLCGKADGNSSNSKTTINNCYSIGAVTGTKKFGTLFGEATAKSLTLDKLYYLSSLAEDANGTAKSAEELKLLDVSADGDLSSTYYQSVCGGYPKLIWEELKDTEKHVYCTHDASETCDCCRYDPAPGEFTYGYLKRSCQRTGCTMVSTTKLLPLTTYAITLPTGTGYTAAAHGSSTSPVAHGESYSFTISIDSNYKKTESFAVKANGVPLTDNKGVYTITDIEANQVITVDGVVEKTSADLGVTVIAPAGSAITAGRFDANMYYKYDFAQPLETGTLEDDRIFAIFPTTSYESFYRVQNPNGVTYWKFAGNSSTFSAGSQYEVTAEMLHIGDNTFTKDTVYSSFEKNAYDKADIYLNINEKGYLAMDEGDTHELNVFRNWMSLGDVVRNSSAALPDVTYTVISEAGTPSSVVSITPNENNSCVATLTAQQPGTAIVLVTYDAMTNANAVGGEMFSAIWPENTGVFVVTVGADGSSIQTNMTANEGLNAAYNKTALDAEHDILFYTGDAGASYSFQPEDGCTVSVARSTVDTKMSFNGFTTAGVTTDHGVVTVSGLTTGAHIIKVEKDGNATYQVVRARKVSYTLSDDEGTPITAENPARPGQKVTVQFSGLISPMEKLSGIYNGNFGFYYNGLCGVEVCIAGGYYGVYTFSSSAGLQKFSFTIPDTWNNSSYTLTDGALRIGGFGSFAGSHRSLTYRDGRSPNLNAAELNGYLSLLPDVVVPTAYTGTPIYIVTLPTGDGYTVTGEATVDGGSDYTFTVSVLPGYDDSELVVKANGTVLTAEADGSYKIPAVSDHPVITVAGVAPIYDVTLPTGEGYTVTGEATVTGGSDYTFTVAVHDGYDGSSMVVKANGTALTAQENGSYKVENVHEALTITVEGVEKQPAIPAWPVISSKPAVKDEETVRFSDVKASDWYYESVKFVCENGLMNGTGNGQFSPDANTTRGMIVTILARLEGVDATKGSNWYEAGQQWAMENGISDGTSMTGEMTREQLATMLYRYAQLKGYDVSASASLNDFTDASSVSDWAQDAMQWAVGVGLIQGSDNQLTPTAPATRAQIAAILMRFMENVVR